MKRIAALLFLASQICCLHAQTGNVAQIGNDDFQRDTVAAWVGLNGDIKISQDVFHGGKRSLEITPGATVQRDVSLRPESKYKLSAWAKTGSGWDEIQVNLTGLGNHNASAASALADWVKLEETFVTGEGQKSAHLEIHHPPTSSKSSVFADDIQIEYLGDYAPEEVASIKPLPVREPRTELGISQQPNEKLAESSH
jgi:hypothetical protein